MALYMVDDELSVADCADIGIWVNEQSLNFHKYTKEQRDWFHAKGQELYSCLDLLVGQQFDQGTDLIQAASRELATAKEKLEAGIKNQKDLTETLEAVNGFLSNLKQLVEMVLGVVI